MPIGCGIVYMASHKMEEIFFSYCGGVVWVMNKSFTFLPLRDGQWIATDDPLAGLTMDKIIAMMVGRRSLNQRLTPDKRKQAKGRLSHHSRCVT